MSKKKPRRLWLLALSVSVLVLLVILVSGIIADWPYRDLTPAEVVSQGIAKIEQGQSYSFTMKAVEIKGDQEKVLTDFSGEVNQGDAKIHGFMPFINAEIDLIRKDQQLFRKDSIDGRWVLIPAVGLENMETFMMEINPLGAFQFINNMDASYVGKEKVGGRKCRVYEVMTRGEHQLLTYYWHDYNYRLWIDQKDGFLKKGEVIAEHRDNALHTLHVTVDFKNYGKKIRIKAPESVKLN